MEIYQIFAKMPPLCCFAPKKLKISAAPILQHNLPSSVITSILIIKIASGIMAGADAGPLATQLQTTLALDGSDQGRISALEQRQLAILKRIEDLERRLGAAEQITPGAAPSASNSAPAPAIQTSVGGGINPPKSTLPIESPVQQKLEKELVEKGITNHRFVRAPPEYYDRPLEFRMGIVGAASVHHLCKTIVMENTRVEDNEPGVTKYYMVIVQYSAKLHSDKLRNFVRAAHGGKLSKAQVNMRLCPEEISDKLTGFEHNGVSPIGSKTQLPIIMSDRIAKLEPDVFWLGAGEVDLKVGMSAADFIKAYEPHVVECTYDD